MSLPLAMWAKKSPEDPPRYHPLLFHMLDVSEVARLLWRELLSPTWTLTHATRWQLSPEQMEGWVSFLAGLHDLGKASPVFQGKDRTALLRLSSMGLSFPEPLGNVPHGLITARELETRLPDDYGVDEDLAARLAACLGGHHGLYPSSADLEGIRTLSVGGQGWREQRRALVRELAASCGNTGTPREDAGRRQSNGFFMVLSGLVCVADWVGSNEAWFPLSGGMDLDTYAPLARVRAHGALAALHWHGASLGERAADFGHLFPRCVPPRPLQEEMIAIMERPQVPRLVLVEAPMGEGKTEAALHAGQAWMSRWGEKGLYVALPTMASSNQMFDRVWEFLERLLPGKEANYMLLHGQAILSEAFQDLRLAGIEADSAGGGDGVPASVLATEWFLKSKRGLLAPFGVGTIDQGLMSVLQTRHFFVRLFGLAHKTVILDEVHAYDAYMSVLMERMLEWLEALDSTVILLSATLPRSRRHALLSAFHGGPVTVPEAPYPRITCLSRDGVTVQPFSASMCYEAEMTALPWFGQDFPARLQAALAGGGCAAVICNTVGRAQEVYGSLRSGMAAHEVGLLHARFPQEERQLREKQAIARFGPPGGPTQRPERYVLVATQVIEQSLDLDFDLMVSELAPVDLLLQRLGRLHRHERGRRPERLSERALWVLGPVEQDGRLAFASGSDAVYERFLLLRTWHELAGRRVLRVPDDVEALIERVYGGSPAPEDLSASQAEDWREAEAKLHTRRERMEAKARPLLVLPPDHPGRIWEDRNLELQEDDPDVHPALQALTRLSDAPTVQVVCLFERGGRHYLDPAFEREVDLESVPGLSLQVRLLGRSLTLSNRSLAPWLVKNGHQPPAWGRTPLLRHHRLLSFDVHLECPLGDGRTLLVLHPELGLIGRRTDA